MAVPNETEAKDHEREPTPATTKVYLLVECEVYDDMPSGYHPDEAAMLTLSEAISNDTRFKGKILPYGFHKYGTVELREPLVITNGHVLEIIEDGKGGVHLVGV